MPSDRSEPTLLAEEELCEALRARRPDPAAFLAGVRRRVAEGEARRRAHVDRFARAPEPLRRAAALLPPELLGPAATGALAVGKKLSLKAVPGLLALPAVSFLMLIVTFVGALSGLRRVPLTTGGATDGAGPSEQEVVSAWWRRNRRSVTVVALVIGLLALLKHPETIVLLLVVSMISMLLLSLELARHGLATRHATGRMLGRMLMTLAVYAWMLRDFLQRDQDATLGLGSPLILLAGGLACLALARTFTWRRVRNWLWDPLPMRNPDRLTMFCLRCLTGTLALFMTGVLAVAIAFLGACVLAGPLDRDRCLRWVDGFDAPPAHSSWGSFVRVAEALRHDGGPAPDLERIGRLAEAADLDGLTGLEHAAVRLGVADQATLERVVGAQSSALRMGERGRTVPIDTWQESAVRASLSLGSLDAEQRAFLVERLDYLLGEPPDAEELGFRRRAAELADLLGHPELVTRHAEVLEETIDALCRQHDGYFALPRTMLYEIAPIQDALWIAQRLGVSAELGSRLRPLARAAVLAHPLRAMRPDPETYVAAVALQALDRVAPPAHPVLETIVAWRALMGAALLAVLCVLITRRAPLEMPPAEAGG